MSITGGQTETTYAGQLGYTGRPITNTMETVYPAADDGPPVRLIPRKVRRTDHLTPADTAPDREQLAQLAEAVLKFHQRVGITAMCKCGRTIVECDVQHHARRLGLIEPLPET